MRDVLITQAILGVIGVVLAIAGFAYSPTNLLLGLIGGVGGVLMVVGAIVVILRKRRSLARH
jgi:hypothetical protein